MKPPILNTFRNIKRISEIITVLFRFGLDDLVGYLGLESFYQKGRQLISGKDAALLENAPFGVRLRRALEELGPTFVKFGQVMSTRSDLFSEETLAELKRLQDHCAVLPFSSVEEVLAVSFPNKTTPTSDSSGEKEASIGWRAVFTSIEETPLAAGSIGQTHRAVLRDGSRVVLKILRPKILDLIQSDIDVLLYLTRHLETLQPNLGFSPVEMVNEFSDQIHQELDLRNEAQSTDRLRALFAETPGVTFPRVYWEAVTRDLLTMEEIIGTPLSRLDIGSLTEDARRNIVENLFLGVFRQCFDFGFFHADPHPGNIFVRSDDSVVFIDCGLTCFIDHKTIDLLAGIFHGMATDDPDRVFQAVVRLADIDPATAERRDFYSDVASYVSRFQSLPLERLNVGNLLQDFFSKLRKYRVHCPSDILFLIKTVCVLESDISAIDPSFDFTRHAAPYISRLVKRQYRPDRVRRELTRSAESFSRLALTVPDHVNQSFDLLKKGRIGFRLTHEGLDHFDRTFSRIGSRLASAFCCGSLLLTGAILFLAEQRAGTPNFLGEMGFVSFALAAAAAIMMALPGWFFRNG